MNKEIFEKLKELEKRLEDKEKATPPSQDLANENKPAVISDEVKTAVLKEYFSGVLGGRQSAIVLDGVGAGVKTPEIRPKTIKEAGNLAKQILSK